MKIKDINWKAMIVVLGLVVAGYSVYQLYWQYARPTYWREQSTLRAKYDDAHDKNNTAMDRETAPVLKKVRKDGRVDRTKLYDTAVIGVRESAALDDDEEALKARLQHRIPANAVPVKFDQPTWQRIGPVVGPTWIMVAKRQLMKTAAGIEVQEDLNPQGLYPAGKPAEYKNHKTVMEEAGATSWIPYQAPLVRFCRNGNCSPGERLQTKTLVCGSYLGEMDAWFNEFVRISGQKSASAFYYNGFDGASYMVWFDNTGAAEACGTTTKTQGGQ